VGAIKHAGQVYPNQSIPLFGCQFPYRCAAGGNPSIAAQNLRAAKILLDPPRSFAPSIAICHIQHEWQQIVVSCRYSARDLCDRRFVDVSKNDLRAGSGEAIGESGTYPAACTCYKRDFSQDVHLIPLLAGNGPLCLAGRHSPFS
jgi:hypothetical protein